MSEWRHVPVEWARGHGWTVPCSHCSDPWPCDAEQMRLRAERAEAAIREVLAEMRNGLTCNYLWVEQVLDGVVERVKP